MLAVGLDDGAAVHEIDETRSHGDPARLEWKARPGDRQFVTVRRKDTNQPLDFEIEGTIPVTLFVGGRAGAPEIVCAKETSGWGFGRHRPVVLCRRHTSARDQQR